MSSPNRSSSVVAAVLSISAMVIAGCAVIITVVLVRDHIEPATPLPLIGSTQSSIKVFDESKVETGITGGF